MECSYCHHYHYLTGEVSLQLAKNGVRFSTIWVQEAFSITGAAEAGQESGLLTAWMEMVVTAKEDKIFLSLSFLPRTQTSVPYQTSEQCMTGEPCITREPDIVGH